MTITKEELDKIMELNPLGNPIEIKFEINGVIGQKTRNNEIVTFQLIYDKYKEYVLWHSAKYAGRDEQYIPKQERFRNIDKFVEERMYEQKFVSGIKSDPRSIYIFGSDIELIKKKYEQTYKTK